MISFHIVPEHGNLYMMNNKNVEVDMTSTFYEDKTIMQGQASIPKCLSP